MSHIGCIVIPYMVHMNNTITNLTTKIIYKRYFVLDEQDDLMTGYSSDDSHISDSHIST